MGYSQRLQKHPKPCNILSTRKRKGRFSVHQRRDSPALPTHLVPKGCSTRACLGVALGNSLSSRCSLIPVRSLMQEENREGILLLPHPTTGKTFQTPTAQDPLKISTSVPTGHEACRGVQSINPNICPSSLSSSLDGGGGAQAHRTNTFRTDQDTTSKSHILNCVSKFLPQILPGALCRCPPPPISHGKSRQGHL